jgi:hypothetical protein
VIKERYRLAPVSPLENPQASYSRTRRLFPKSVAELTRRFHELNVALRAN